MEKQDQFRFKPVAIAMLALLGVSLLTGCATHSDKLGFTKDEATMTYAQSYEPARQMLLAGEWDALRTTLQQNAMREVKEVNTGDTAVASGTETKEGVQATEVEPAKEALTDEEEYERLVQGQSELSLIERGLLTLNLGDFKRALFYFDAAEEKLGLTEDAPDVSAKTSKFGKLGLSMLTGSEELANYELRGYEKVMLLNYKALCYMLMGDRKAYNVTRRAIDRQQEEWEKFQQLLAANEAELAQKAKEKSLSDKEGPTLADVDTQSSEVKAKAALVSSAYVNPFADYLNAMMLEIDGFDDPTMRQNAKIAYKKVVDNNADCTDAKNAVRTVEKGLRKNQKMVQVLLFDGFAPYQVEETKVFELKSQSGREPLKLAVNFSAAQPVPTNVARVRVLMKGQKRDLSSLTKMESLILRDEADRMPMRLGMTMLAYVRSLTGGALLGNLGTGLMQKIQHPDTRSWLTLPNQVYVARLAVPKNLQSLTLKTYDQNGGVVATEDISLAKDGPTVVYAVSYNQHLKAYANPFSWVK